MLMNIVVSSNKNFIYPLSVLLYSLYVNNENVNVYFINFSVEESDLYDLKRLTSKFPTCSFNIINMPEDMVRKFDETALSSHTLDLMKSRQLSIETYGKVVTPCLLPKELDRCLYLDADIIVQKNIEDFYNSDLEGKSLMGFCVKKFTVIPPKNAFPGVNEIFNAGVLLLDLNKIRSTGVLDYNKVLDHIEYSMHNTNMHFDEFVMNTVFKDDVLFGDTSKFNFPANFFGNINRFEINEYNKNVDILKESYIIHYMSKQKPWDEKSSLHKPSKDIWKDYCNNMLKLMET